MGTADIWLIASRQVSLPRRILPLPKHNLPVRSPAEACVPTNAGTQPCPLPLSSQFQPWEIVASKPYINTETPSYNIKSPNYLVLIVLEPDMTSCYDLQDSINILIKLPRSLDVFSEDGLLFSRIYSSEDYLEGSLRPPDAQGDIPIKLVILASHRPWEDTQCDITPQCPRT